MPKLNDLQSILLATAAQRDDGSLYPLADSVSATSVRLTKAVASLIKAGFVEERDVGRDAAIYCRDDERRIGVFVTPAGLAAIGLGEEVVSASSPAVASEASDAPRPTKTSGVLDLLRRDEGATLPELIAATDWLPHTTRAALTGLRKRGHTINRGKRDGVTCYSIVATA